MYFFHGSTLYIRTRTISPLVFMLRMCYRHEKSGILNSPGVTPVNLPDPV